MARSSAGRFNTTTYTAGQLSSHTPMRLSASITPELFFADSAGRRTPKRFLNASVVRLQFPSATRPRIRRSQLSYSPIYIFCWRDYSSHEARGLLSPVVPPISAVLDSWLRSKGWTHEGI